MIQPKYFKKPKKEGEVMELKRQILVKLVKRVRNIGFLFLLVAVLAFGLFTGSCNEEDGGGPQPTPTPSPTPTPTPGPTPTPTPPPQGFQPGDIIPGFVLTSNPSGSIGDVHAKGTYTAGSGKWTVVFTRSLTTGFPEEDVQFNFTSSANLYHFSIAYLDNTGAAPPMSASAPVMLTQDITAYTLGNEASGADLEAKQETPSDCSEFTGAPLVTNPINPASVPQLTLMAAYDGTNFYLCVEAPDPNSVEDILKQHWEFIGPDKTDWERKQGVANVMGGEPGKFDEDRIAIWWDINAQGFETSGCFALCHDDRMRSNNTDGRADLWHWKAARTNTAGFADDQRLDPDISKCPITPCRQDDSATKKIASGNEQTVDSTKLPAFMAETDPSANALFLFEDEIPPDCSPEDCALAVPFDP